MKPKAPADNRIVKLAYSVNEASVATSFSVRTIWNMIGRGDIESRKIGGRVIIPAQSLEHLINRAA